MNNMKSIFEAAIRRGGYDLAGMLRRIDSYHVDGKISDDERMELYDLARSGAKPENSVDLMAKVSELSQAIADAVKRIDKLEKQLNGESSDAPDVPDGGGSAEPAPEEYVPGKWYWRGNRVSFGGGIFRCTAPEGQVCTWSPAEYPAYWEAEM